MPRAHALNRKPAVPRFPQDTLLVPATLFGAAIHREPTVQGRENTPGPTGRLTLRNFA
jgi:hypothetical protein